MIKKITVIGGTGLLGKPVVEELLIKGYEVVVLTRNTEKAKSIFGTKVKIIEGDVFDKIVLSEAIEGCDGLHISLASPQEAEAVKLLVEIGQKHSIKHVMYISGSSVSKENTWFPMTANKYVAEKIIMDSGLPWTIFAPTFIMETLPLMVRGKQASIIGNQSSPLSWVSAQDLARIVVKSLTTKEAMNKKFFVHGSEKFLMKEALEKYVHELHPEIKKVKNLPICLGVIISKLTRNKELEYAVDLFGYFEKTEELGNPKQTNEVFGKPEITLEKFIELKKGKIVQSCI